MRQAIVNVNKRPAGLLQETKEGKFIFQYRKDYLEDEGSAPVSVTLPKRFAAYTCDHLFPCFFSLLSEGANKAMQCKSLRIDEDDFFGLLLATAQNDCIGFLTFTPINDE